MFTIWTATGQSASEALRYVLTKTQLRSYPTITRRIHPAHSHKFRRNPPIIREVLRWDRPPLIVTYNRRGDDVPVFGFLISTHVPMGQNAFQALPQVIGAAQAGIPVVWVQPTSAVVTRRYGRTSVESMPSLVWHVLWRISCFTHVPTVLIPMDNGETWIDTASGILNFMMDFARKGGNASGLMSEPIMHRLLTNMKAAAPSAVAPLSGNSGRILDAPDIANYLVDHGLDRKTAEFLEDKLRGYSGHFVFVAKTRRIRSDPYAGTAAAYDYAFCRTGRSTRDRDRSLVLHFPKVSFEEGWKRFFASPPNKDTRLFLTLADALVFSDGLLCHCEQGWLPMAQSFPEKYLIPPPEDYDPWW